MTSNDTPESSRARTVRPRRRRRLLITTATVLIVLIGYGLWSNLREFTLRAEIDIPAPPEKVWAVLADQAAYPEWNPFLVSSTGDMKVGATLTNTMRGTDGSDMVFDPTVLAVDPGRELRWIGKVPPGLLFDGEHSFVLTATDAGTHLVQSEVFTGALVPFMHGWLTDDTLSQFHAMNQALADRVASVG